MKTSNFANGLTSLCLTLLAGCASAPPSPAPTLIVSGCPVVVPCQLPATAPTRNGQLLTDQERTELAWADCAAQVDRVYQHQVTHEQAR
ncbi:MULTISPECIES: Rz1-like lysis system protein LysC [unclassified Pseudomonas]|uniref:Rz1-like lysis system protein LysC n=1 Tax=unclassified Pseudomonas TaxID=196821 RepID=UPI002449E23E|nr:MULTISPECIES: Rz1-like lysis system protein LysC [unclassified Pseudomonas]MDH0301236.1 Rz1-like lysis system protein LysC [Pseudomonas sp. GD04091]MDH1984694.1 Rz1-like lysis system protein LysC [Pseudomonas sp. GD03689]